MAVEELLRVVAPPDRPEETGDSRQRVDIEETMGTRLPNDYFDFAAHYGTGHFDGFWSLDVLNPYSRSYFDRVWAGSRALRESRGLPLRGNHAYGVHPDRPGWLIWGRTDVGDLLCWVTEGEPDHWPILIISDRNKSFQQVGMPMTTFLARLLSGELTLCFMANRELPPRSSVSFCTRPSPCSDSKLYLREDSFHPSFPWECEWLPIDELDRPTGARVTMGPGSIGVKPWNGFALEEGFTVYPPWWHELPHPLHRWRRGQLLGWRLGGPAGVFLHNLIPLKRDTQTKLRILEIGAASLVLLGGRIDYTVRAIYEGANRFPIRLTAKYSHIMGLHGVDGLTECTIENK